MNRKITNERHVARVVKKLYEDAQELDWEHLTSADHTKQYGLWLTDPEVGGLLEEWMTLEEARVWIKDRPMKEYARALAGFGEFAKYLSTHPRGPATVIRHSLGEDWDLVEGSEGIKPLHCDAVNGDDRERLYWGPARDFKHLLYAGLVASDKPPASPVRLVIVETVTRPTSRAKKKRHERFCKRCGLLVSHIRL